MTASRPLERGARAVAWPAAPRDADALLAAMVPRAAGMLAAAAAVACGVVIALRRISGAIEPAGPVLLLVTTAAGISCALAADAARHIGASLAARCGLVLAVAALALPLRSTGSAGWLALAVAAAASAATWLRLPRRGAGQPVRHDAPAPPIRRRRGAPQPDRGARRDGPPGVLRQRFERRELAAGAERVRGRVVVAVPAGAKAGFGHLGFCPAFAAQPTVEVTTAYDGVEVTVVAAEVVPWGVRVECRLAEPAEEPLEIPVDLVASAPTGGD